MLTFISESAMCFSEHYESHEYYDGEMIHIHIKSGLMVVTANLLYTIYSYKNGIIEAFHVRDNA